MRASTPCITSISNYPPFTPCLGLSFHDPNYFSHLSVKPQVQHHLLSLIHPTNTVSFAVPLVVYSNGSERLLAGGVPLAGTGLGPQLHSCGRDCPPAVRLALRSSCPWSKLLEKPLKNIKSLHTFIIISLKPSFSVQEKTRQDHAVTAQGPSAKLQHKYMGNRKAVGTPLHLALQLCSYLLSTLVHTWNSEDNFLSRGPSMETGRNCLLLSFPPLPPSVHSCSCKKGYGEQLISSPHVQVALWSQLQTQPLHL